MQALSASAPCFDYELFFASLNAAMTSTLPVLPVNFCTSGSSSLMKTLCFFSSPIVNLPMKKLYSIASVYELLANVPVVTSFSFAYFFSAAMSWLSGSMCELKATLLFVYSCCKSNQDAKT